MRTLYESKEDYYKPIKIRLDYIEYEGNGDKDKILLVKECLDMIRQYLRDIILKLKENVKFN